MTRKYGFGALFGSPSSICGKRMRRIFFFYVAKLVVPEKKVSSGNLTLRHFHHEISQTQSLHGLLPNLDELIFIFIDKYTFFQISNPTESCTRRIQKIINELITNYIHTNRHQNKQTKLPILSTNESKNKMRIINSHMICDNIVSLARMMLKFIQIENLPIL